MLLALVIALLSTLAFVFPYTIYPWTLKLLPKENVQRQNVARLSNTYALVFCAHNEERALPEKIKNIQEIKKLLPDIEVVAYADACTDKTETILASAAATLRYIAGRERAGKATGMRRIMETLDRDVVIFTDANVTLEPESAVRLLAYFENTEIGCVAGQLHYVNASDSTTAMVGSLYWRLEEKIKQLETSTGSTMGADGSIFATRRSLYPSVPPNLLDDMTVSMEPLFQAYRVISAQDVHAFERAVATPSEEFKRKRRIACRAYQTYLHLAPKINELGPGNRYKFYSHKVLRWFGVVPLSLAAIAFSYICVVTVGATTACVGFVFLLLSFWLCITVQISAASSAWEIIKSVVATGIGVLEAMRGKDYTTWSPATSRN